MAVLVLAVGGWTLGRAHQDQLSQQASWHQVPALVLKVWSGVQGYGGHVALASQARARWTGDGHLEQRHLGGIAGRGWGTTLRSG